MPDIKLSCLPDRTPVRLTLNFVPELHDALVDYARFYAQAYGREEKISDLVPHMLSAWLDADRAFAAFRKERAGRA